MPEQKIVSADTKNCFADVSSGQRLRQGRAEYRSRIQHRRAPYRAVRELNRRSRQAVSDRQRRRRSIQCQQHAKRLTGQEYIGRGDVWIQAHHVPVRHQRSRSQDEIAAAASSKKVGIVARAAHQNVIARTAIEQIVTAARVQGIAALIPQQYVVAARPDQAVGPGAAANSRQQALQRGRVPHGAVRKPHAQIAVIPCPAKQLRARAVTGYSQVQSGFIHRQCNIGGRHVCGKLDDIGVAWQGISLIYRIESGVTTNHISVVPRTAGKHVAACAAIDPVVTGTRTNDIPAKRSQHILALIQSRQDLADGLPRAVAKLDVLDPGPSLVFGACQRDLRARSLGRHDLQHRLVPGSLVFLRRIGHEHGYQTRARAGPEDQGVRPDVAAVVGLQCGMLIAGD